MSIQHVREKFPDSLKLFGLIGMLPSGVSKDELTQLWGNNRWKKYKDVLVRSSLLIHRNEDNSDVYSMLPFMSERACEILDENIQQKTELHFKCCTLYMNYCYEFYTSDKDILEIEGLASIESNIWACIYRAIENVEDSPIKDRENSLTQTGEEPSHFLTPGGPDDHKTPRANSVSTDSEYLNDLLLDLETYRSLSAHSFVEGNFIN